MLGNLITHLSNAPVMSNVDSQREQFWGAPEVFGVDEVLVHQGQVDHEQRLVRILHGQMVQHCPAPLVPLQRL